ncbi:hypothetical protein VC863_24130, partial [Citrobacter freundii]|nr:hypothetical protein [Citrobacter freundii]
SDIVFLSCGLRVLPSGKYGEFFYRFYQAKGGQTCTQSLDRDRMASHQRNPRYAQDKLPRTIGP